jgi:hypothetical protein
MRFLRISGQRKYSAPEYTERDETSAHEIGH